MVYDTFLYIGIAVAVIYSIYLIAEYVWKHKRRESVPQKKAINKKAVMLCRYSGQRLRLNLMAMEAARKMTAAAKHSTEQKWG